MTLEEAIKHAEEVAEENQRVFDKHIVFGDVKIDIHYCDDTEVTEEYLVNCQMCAKEHRQLAKWLKDYKRLLEQKPKTGHWKLVQRGKSIDICCSNCEKVRIKQYAYNYTIDQLDKEDLEKCFECADMRYCPNCGAKMESEANE